MKKSPGELHTITEVIAYCRDVASHKPEALPRREQEGLAARIVGLYFNDRVDTWEEQYSELARVLNIASDLEWSNESVEWGWRRIRELVDQLDEKVGTVQKDMGQQSM